MTEHASGAISTVTFLFADVRGRTMLWGARSRRHAGCSLSLQGNLTRSYRG